VLGLVGTLLWVAFVTWRDAAESQRDRYAALLAAMLAFAVGAAFDWFWEMAALGAIFFLAGGVVVAFLPGAVGGVAAPALLVQAATATLTRWLAGRYADRRGGARLLVPAVVLAAAGMATAAATGSGIAVLAGMALFGTGFGLAQAASLTTMLQRVAPDRYGAVSAVWNAAYDLGWGVGAIGVGLVVASLGAPAGFVTAALLTLVALPLATRRR